MDVVPVKRPNRKPASKKPGKPAHKVAEKPDNPDGNAAECQGVSEKPSRDSGISEDLQPPPPPPKVDCLELRNTSFY